MPFSEITNVSHISYSSDIVIGICLMGHTWKILHEKITVIEWISLRFKPKAAFVRAAGFFPLKRKYTPIHYDILFFSCPLFLPRCIAQSEQRRHNYSLLKSSFLQISALPSNKDSFKNTFTQSSPPLRDMGKLLFNHPTYLNWFASVAYWSFLPFSYEKPKD